MDRVLPSQNPAAALLEPDSEELQLRVDSFRKLGYSSEEVRSALRKLGLGTDTNSVLGELVRSRATTAPSGSASDGGDKRTGQKESLLPPSWTLGPRITSQPGHQKSMESHLRPVVIDGSNVAMSHGNKEVFSCRGIQLAVDFFLDRGHNTITVFVPTWRKEQPRPDAPITDQHILMDLEKRKIVVFTPSRRVGGKRVVCYDDRFIIKLAYEFDGVIVSNDTYRDLQGERPEWKKCIEERLLMYSFVNDKFMPPDDPLGRHGPSLDNFLRKSPLPVEQKRQLCPYDKKCTYGIKCKFYHPERVNQSYLSLADELREKAQISTAKEDKCATSSPQQVHLDTRPARIATSHPRDANTEPSRDQQSSAHQSLFSENQMQYWENPRNGSTHYYPNISHEYMDSGFSSFESQYSDNSYCLANSQMARSQQQPSNNSISSGCSSQTLTSTSHPHYHRNVDPTCQPNYPPIFPPHQLSLPHNRHYSGVLHPQQNYWSDPFQGLPKGRTINNLPLSHRNNSLGSFEGHERHSWGHIQPPPAAFDAQKMDLRKKLQAIFKPQEVDTVMEMYPHLMDAEKLAAKILNMKAQRSIF